MSKKNDPKKTVKKLNPVKAGIYIAIISLVSAVTVAVVTNFDKIWPQTQQKSQADEIIAFQEHQYNEISGVLDERVSQAQAEETELATPQQAKRAPESEGYIKNNRDTKVAVAQKHAEFKAAVRSGDLFGANVIKTELNALLGKEKVGYLSRPSTLRGSKKSLTMPPYYAVGLQQLSMGRLASEYKPSQDTVLGFVNKLNGR